MSLIKIDSYFGFGDQIYMRPFVCELAKTHRVYIKTPFPDILYSNTDVKCVAPVTILKTQKEWAEKKIELFAKDSPKYDKIMRPSYTPPMLNFGQTVIQGFKSQFNVPKIDFELPVSAEQILKAKKVLGKVPKSKKLCVLKLPTLRKEWMNASRNAKMEYFNMLIEKYKNEFYFVSVADCRNQEWIDGELSPHINKIFHKAEFELDAYVGLFKIADCVIGTPSNIIPLALAVKTPLFVVAGGYVPVKYLIDEEMGLERFGLAEPKEPCFCLKHSHGCDKNIDENTLFNNFENWRVKVAKRTRTTKKTEVVETKIEVVEEVQKAKSDKNLLISRLRAWRCKEIADNKYIKEFFDNVVGLDHDAVSTYEQVGLKGYRLNTQTNHNDWVETTKDAIIKEKITHCLIAQKLDIMAEATYQACVELGVKVIWAEAFFDDKLILDYTSLQYTFPNDISIYAKSHEGKLVEYPTKTRQPQKEQDLSKEEFYSKYNLNPNKPMIALIGQVTTDMAVKNSICAEVKTYEEFLRTVIESNKDTQIVFKPHPQSPVGKVKFITEYPNVTIADESLETYYNSFYCFVTFSSTVSFEALCKGKAVAICGHTLISNDKICLQLRKQEKFIGLYKRLSNLIIDVDFAEKWKSFITTKYAVSMKSEAFAQKLVMTEEEFYKGS